MDGDYADVIEMLRRPAVLEMAIDVLLCAVPIWMAVMIGMVIGWSWRPRWTGLLFLGLRSKLRFFIPPGFGARRLWFAVSAVSALSVCRGLWRDFVGVKDQAVPRRRSVMLNTEIDGSSDGERSSIGISEIKEEVITEKDLDHLLNLLDDKGDNVWQNLMQRTAPNMIYQAWSNEPEVGPIMYRSKTVFEDATPEFVRDFFSDDEFRLQWDPMLTHFKILEESTRTGETVVHWIKKFPFFCSDREYIIGRRIWESGKTYYCVTKAVPYPALRKREKPRRVEQYFSSWRIKAVESLKQDGHLSACEVTLVHYEDMGIPKDIAKVGVRHGMWGTVKKLQSGMRSYELNRKSNAPLSRSALLAQTTTICSLDPACSDEQNSKKEVEIPIKDAGINWKWVALGGMVALLFGASRTIRKK